MQNQTGRKVCTPEVLVFAPGQDMRYTGKTLLASHTARILAEKKRVLVIDCDHQGDLTESFKLFLTEPGSFWADPKFSKISGLRFLYNQKSFFDYLIGKSTFTETLVRPSRRANLWVSVSDFRMRGSEPRIDSHEINPDVFKKVLAEVRENFEIIIIDLSPDESMLFPAALRVATNVFVPFNVNLNEHKLSDGNLGLLDQVGESVKFPFKTWFVLNRVETRDGNPFVRSYLETFAFGTVTQTYIKNYKYRTPRSGGLNRFNKNNSVTLEVGRLLSEVKLFDREQTE